MAKLYLGVDVGTKSVRAGLFDGEGRRAGMGVCPIDLWNPSEDHHEQSSEGIFRAAGEAIRQALSQAGATGADVAGVGFDGTCSLVALGEGFEPVSVSTTGRDEQNVIVWMDHRATEQASRINGGGHEVLRYVGGVISPEMQTPKLLWLKERLPSCWGRARRFLDLPDFMVYRATGVDVRSLCTTVCKWTYLGHDGEGGRWDDRYLEAIGLGELSGEGHGRIGTTVRPMGEPVGGLTAAAARELGLREGTPVGVSIIDAHAGGLGLIGIDLGGGAPSDEQLEHRLALIGGTSTCHMAVSREARYVPGVWGPYFSAMVPGMWLTEGGQSATGSLIDHVVHGHAQSARLADEARQRGTTIYALLNERVAALAGGGPVAGLTRELHVLPDHHGNRSPRADASLRGMVSGLRLSDSVDSLALLYLATIEALAHGTRHIIDTMNRHGYQIDTLIACGGDTKNPLFVQAHADVTGCAIALPAEAEAVLLGAAMLGASASGDVENLRAAMAAMNRAGEVVRPSGGAVAAYHDKKHRVFLRMHDDQMAYRGVMVG